MGRPEEGPTRRWGWRVRGVLAKEGREQEGPGGPCQALPPAQLSGAGARAVVCGAVVQGTGVRSRKEATEVDEPGLRASYTWGFLGGQWKPLKSPRAAGPRGQVHTCDW